MRRSRAGHGLDHRTISADSSSPVCGPVDELSRITILDFPTCTSTSVAPACLAARTARAMSAWVMRAGRRLMAPSSPGSMRMAAMSLEIVQTIAQRAQRRLGVAPVDGDCAGLAADAGAVGGQRHDRPTAEQPAHPGLVISGQTTVRRRRPVRDRSQPEQIPRCPAQRLSLLAPLRKEAVAVL